MTRPVVILILLAIILISGTLAIFSKDFGTALKQVSCCHKGNACWTGDPLCGWPVACNLWNKCRTESYMKAVTISDCESLDYEC